MSFDFGFTAVDEHELEAVQTAQRAITETTSNVDELQDRLNNLYNAIIPLLTNLKANPEKDFISWPGHTRLRVIEEFEAKLLKILQD